MRARINREPKSDSPGKPDSIHSIGSFDRMATPFQLFCPWATDWYPSALEFTVRKEIVGHLELLKADDIGLTIRQPEFDVVEARAKAVDVPGRDLQNESFSLRSCPCRSRFESVSRASPSGPCRMGRVRYRGYLSSESRGDDMGIFGKPDEHSERARKLCQAVPNACPSRMHISFPGSRSMTLSKAMNEFSWPWVVSGARRENSGRRRGLSATSVGYVAGHTPNPTYREVCSGRTGHTEAVRAIYDPSRTTFEEMLRVFWENHDPTQGMKQGNDQGTQYRSGLYYYGESQKVLALASLEAFSKELESAGFGSITTEVCEAPEYYFAEDEHQQYLAKNPSGYCGLGGTGVQCQIGLTSPG